MASTGGNSSSPSQGNGAASTLGSNPNNSNTGLFSSVTDPAAQQSLQQRLFGLVNEGSTNLSHVPTGSLVAPGQSFTFQHARYAISGAQLGQVLAQPHDAARVTLMNSMLNHPGLAPIYRPGFVGMPPSASPHSMTPGVPGQPLMSYPMAMQTTNFMPQLPPYTSVVAQRLPKSSGPQFFSSAQVVGAVPSTYQALHQQLNPAWAGAAGQMAFVNQTSVQTASSSNNGGIQTQVAYGAKDRKRVSKRTSIGSEDEDLGKKKRKKRDPTLPTPARFAWNFFFRDQYTKIRNSEPSEHSNVQKAFTDIGFDLGKKWKSLTKEEKEPYLKLAAQDKERYEREMQARFGANAAVMAPSAGASTTGESSEEDEEEEKVCLVVHELEVDDQRPEEEKKSEPTEGELVADVLVVDDDEVFLKIIRHKLVVGQKHPPRVMTVTSASDAKRMLLDEHKKFGTVLLDKDLGEGKEDGISSLAVIREAGYQGVIVGVTGSTDDATKSQFAESGADKTFIKGTSNFYDDLLALVKLHSKNAQQMEKDEEHAPVKAS